MSSTTIGKIIKEAGAGNDKKKDPAAKQRTEEIVKELVADAPTTSQQPQITKRGPGRPKGSGASPGRPKTPPHTLEEMNSAAHPNTTTPRKTLSPTDQIRNQIIVERLRLYVRKFPEYSGFFAGYNPLEHHPDENQKLVDAFLELIHSEVEFATAPAAVTDGIEGVEKLAVAWAIKNPTHPAAKVVEDLSGASSALLSDKAVSLDLRLLECEIVGFLPKNPKLRLCINIARKLISHWGDNQIKAPAVAPPKESFSGL